MTVKSYIIENNSRLSTRWNRRNSSLYMLERLVKLKEKLTYAMLSFKDEPVMLNAQEWEVVDVMLFSYKNHLEK